MNLEIVLKIQTYKIVAVVLKLAGSLSKSQITAIVSQLSRKEGRDGWKAELCRLKELV